MNKTLVVVLVVVLVVAWVVVGLLAGLWMASQGHAPLWTLIAIVLGPLVVPIALERVQRRPGLAAVGSKGGGDGLSTRLLGSVSAEVIQHSRVPVLVIKPVDNQERSPEREFSGQRTTDHLENI